MLSEFSIGNYQAFSTPQRVQLKPITLIFGPNSAGKSSILRSLLVAQHAIVNGKLSKSEGAGERHPGCYTDIVRNGNANSITFAFTVQPEGKSGEEALELGLAWKENRSGSLETVALSLKQNQSDVVTYSAKGNLKHLRIQSLGDDLRRLITAARWESDAKGSLDELVYRWVKIQLSLQKGVALPGMDVDDFRIADSDEDDFPDIYSAIKEMNNQENFVERFIGFMDKVEAAADAIKKAISIQINAVDNSVRDALSKMIYHGPIRPICDEITKARKSEPGMMEWWNLAAGSELLAKVNAWLASDIFQTKYRLEFDRLFPDSSLQQLLKSLSGERGIGQLVEAAFRAKLDSDEEFYESLVDSVAPDLEQDLETEYEDEGERIAEARQRARDLIYNDSDWRGMEHYNSLLADSDVDGIESFLIGWINKNLADLRDELESVREGGFDSAKIRFLRSGSVNAVSPTNMGIGFSQMMPLVASAFGSENRLIVIEQPELHVHPALQTALGDIFIQSSMERKNRFLIETHSEHLILRIMRCMRETFEGHRREGLPPVTPNDVCILYVEPSEGGSIVREMPLNERGELIKGWPGGFFEEALNEMF